MRKPTLLATLVIAAMAMTATTALAATEIRNADTYELCPEVSPAIDKENPPTWYGHPYQEQYEYESGGCTVHLTQNISSPTTLVGYWGAEQCRFDYVIHVGPDGWGYADNFQHAHDYCVEHFYTPGSRILMPPDVNPGNEFPAVDGDTDFNVELNAWFLHPTAGYGSFSGPGFASLDVTNSDPLTVDNQLDVHPVYGIHLTEGSWEADPEDPGLIITHN